MEVSRCYGLSEKVKLFNQKAEEHRERQAINPFSESAAETGITTVRKLSIKDPDYGRPVAGSKTEERGLKAEKQVKMELRTLCEIIYDIGVHYPQGRSVVTFKQLFDLYNLISNNCVGLLVRARRYGLVDFEGEMLYQRKDDDVEITLLKSMEEVCKILGVDVPTYQLPITKKNKER